VDGVITNQKTPITEQIKAANEKAGGALDKDAFLQLLVAQMKYQDPLQPTSNTEYISQLATFSELEEMQNVSASMDMSRANALVGQYVFMNVTDSNGKTTYPEGQVDYVVYQGGKIFLSVNEQLYNIDDLDTVADPEYLLATRLADSFTEELNKLPKPELIGEKHIEDIETLMKVYDGMNSYQRDYISKETMNKFESILEVYKVLKPSEETDSSEETEGSSSDSEEG
jgi:flagellar basal-body rod modification protein FlgD